MAPWPRLPASGCRVVWTLAGASLHWSVPADRVTLPRRERGSVTRSSGWRQGMTSAAALTTGVTDQPVLGWSGGGQSWHVPLSGAKATESAPLGPSLAHQYDHRSHLLGGSGSMGVSGALSCTFSSRKPGSSPSFRSRPHHHALSCHQAPQPPAATTGRPAGALLPDGRSSRSEIGRGPRTTTHASRTAHGPRTTYRVRITDRADTTGRTGISAADAARRLGRRTPGPAGPGPRCQSGSRTGP